MTPTIRPAMIIGDSSRAMLALTETLVDSTFDVVASVMDSGFAEPDVREDDIPYMCSPASRHGRLETVVTIVADKERSVALPPRHRALPDWLAVAISSPSCANRFITPWAKPPWKRS